MYNGWKYGNGVKWPRMYNGILGAMVMEVYMLCNCTGYDCGCAMTMDVWDVQ